jgi:hypothetical protein
MKYIARISKFKNTECRSKPLQENFNIREVNGRIILRWIFRKWDVGVWTGSSWLRIGTGEGNL